MCMCTSNKKKHILKCQLGDRLHFIAIVMNFKHEVCLKWEGGGVLQMFQANTEHTSEPLLYFSTSIL